MDKVDKGELLKKIVNIPKTYWDMLESLGGWGSILVDLLDGPKTKDNTFFIIPR